MLKPNNKYTSFYSYAFAALLIILCCIYFYHDIIELFPTFIHAWTQSDRLAIAMNFQENGFDLFHPATFNLMTKHGITQVDFPIHDYLVACFSSIFGTDIIVTFRLYNILYSLIGLYFIFKMGVLLSASKVRSFILAFFIFTLPFYVYYQAGFLPSIPSFANLFIGLYLFLCFQKSNKSQTLYWAIFFITLSALSRTSFAIFWIATALFQSLIWYRRKKIDFAELVPFLIGFLILLAYFLYNQHLSSKYGSMFLQFLLPITSFSDLTDVLGTFLNRWSNSLFGISHFLFALMVLIAGITQINKKGFLNQLHSKMAIYFLISSLGVFLFFFLMGKQYIDHDYYLIDTFLPLLVILLLICISSISLPEKLERPIWLLFALFAVAFVLEAKQLHDERYEIPYNDRVNLSYQKYVSAAPYLDEWGVEKQDTVIFIGSYSTNIPLIVWERKGYTLLNTSKDSIKKYLAKPFQYAVLLDSFRVRDVLRNYKGIMYSLDRKYEHNGLAVYTPTDNPNKIGFFDNFINYQKLDFETPVDPEIFSANLKIDYPDDTSSLSLEILPIHEYSLSYKKDLQQVIENKDLHVVVQADYLNQLDSSGVNLVCQYRDVYQSRYFSSELKDTSSWQNHQSHFVIPSEKLEAGKTLSIYYWNQGKSELYIDNYSLLIFQ